MISFQDFQFTLLELLRKLFRMPIQHVVYILRASLVACVFSAAALAAEEPSREALFEKGLAAYQSKQYSEARDAFQTLLDKGNTTPALLNNMALSAYQLDQKPLALALWRKALSVQPNFAPAVKGRDFLETKMNMRPLERDSLSMWTHRFLETISIFELLWVNALTLTIAGWLAIRYLGERQFAIEEEQPMPVFPTLTAVFIALFVFTATVSFYKLSDNSSIRATITSAKVSVRSLPTDDGVNLFEISGGSEVYVKNKQKGWLQIENAEGTSGWVKDSELLVTSM